MIFHSNYHNSHNDQNMKRPEKFDFMSKDYRIHERLDFRVAKSVLFHNFPLCIIVKEYSLYSVNLPRRRPKCDGCETSFHPQPNIFCANIAPSSLNAQRLQVFLLKPLKKTVLCYLLYQ